MTLSEIDAALMRLPTTPTTDEDRNLRADLVRRRGELEQAAKTTAEANGQPKPRGNLMVFVPPAIGTSTYYSDRGRVAQSRATEDGRVVLDLFVGEFKSLLMGRDGLLWQNLNPDAMLAIAGQN
jgi:hypothetical protein